MKLCAYVCIYTKLPILDELFMIMKITICKGNRMVNK